MEPNFKLIIWISESESFGKNTLWTEQEPAGNIPEMRMAAEFMSFLKMLGQWITPGEMTDMQFIVQKKLLESWKACTYIWQKINPLLKRGKPH